MMQATQRPAADYNFLIAADFTIRGDSAYRLSQEIRFMVAKHATIGLVQIRKPDFGETISSEVQACLRRGLAQIVSADQLVEADCLVLHGPSRLVLAALPALTARLREVAVVCHDKDDLQWAVKPILATNARVRVFAVNPLLRALATGPVEPQDWRPVLLDSGMGQRREPAIIPAVAWLDIAGLTEAEVRTGSDQGTALPEVKHFSLSDAGVRLGMNRLPALSLDRILGGLDVMVVAPPPGSVDLPDALIAAGLQAGLPVLMPKALQAIYGNGPTYFSPQTLAAAVTAAIMRKPRRNLGQIGGTSGYLFGCQRGAAAKFLTQFQAPPSGRPKSAPRPLLCLAANGVGVGHLTRLLAVARRTAGEVVFATHAPAVDLVRQFGYPVEYIPSAAAVDGDFSTWDVWFKAHLDRVLDKWDPAVVVYDGNNPSPGLIEAVASRHDCRLVWMRRGMWANTTSPHMDNARWCDLVIEPGEIATSRDHGVTAQRRREALQVDPIRLLDREDLLDRAHAAARLGLNPARPAVLIQLGSGFNRDLLSVLDHIVKVLAGEPGLQIAIAEWVNGSIPLALWPDVTILRGFPISQYVNAFDFCISAAGYNSFHELISFAVPTIFVANRHPSMDDQYGRAQFAQDRAAAFELSETDLADLPDLVKLLSQASARSFLTRNCELLGRPNGAGAAADAVAALASRNRARAS